MGDSYGRMSPLWYNTHPPHIQPTLNHSLSNQLIQSTHINQLIKIQKQIQKQIQIKTNIIMSSIVIRTFCPQFPEIQCQITGAWFDLSDSAIEQFEKKAGLTFKIKRDNQGRRVGYKVISNQGKKKFTTGTVSKNGKTGQSTTIQIVEELVENHLEDATEHYKQCVVYSILQDECAAYKAPKEKDSTGKTIRGSGGPNITPYGKAVRILCEMLGVVHETKFQTSEDGMSLVRVPFVREMSEAQKASMKKGRESNARSGVKKNKSRVVKILEQDIQDKQEKIEKLEKFILDMHSQGFSLDAENMIGHFIMENNLEKLEVVEVVEETVLISESEFLSESEEERPTTPILPEEKEEPEKCEKYNQECSADNLCSSCRTDSHYKEPEKKNVVEELLADTDEEDKEDEEEETPNSKLASSYINEDETVMTFKQVLKEKKNECSTKAERKLWSEDYKQAFNEKVIEDYHNDMIKLSEEFEGFSEALESFKVEYC
tara:strand:- start:77 stop:1540 length:1464 start_codon:yes stop_codon:yes gene_type:complete